MNEHLRFISREAGSDAQVILVLDQAGWHVAKDLQIPQNITLYHLPHPMAHARDSSMNRTKTPPPDSGR